MTGSHTDFDRIVIVGTTGSGKSTLGRQLSALTGARHLELDSFSHGPNWQPTPMLEFRTHLAAIAEKDRWVVDGNYIDDASPSLWPRAQLIVWLDLPLTVTLRRLICRSVTRIMRRTELWQGNRETWRMLAAFREG